MGAVRAAAVVFGIFFAIFGVVFTLIRGPHISDGKLLLIVFSLSAFLTAASVFLYWFLERSLAIRALQEKRNAK